MREILFRAKAINRTGCERSNYKNGGWVYGLITKLYNEKYDLPAEMTDTLGISGIEVDYNTIGQYTGLTDKNGVKIFDGDIVRYNGTVHEVVFESRCGSAYYGIVVSNIETWGFNNSTPASEMEVIGNIYENSSLLEEESDKEEGYTCDGSIKGIKGIKGIGKPKNCMECWFSDWRGQETHGNKTRVMIHCDVKHRYKDRDKREPYVFNAETNEPKFPGWCPVVWEESE